METRKRLSLLTNIVAVILLAAANAYAESTSKVFVSKLSVGIFLGFCALLLLVQLIPALMTLYGMIKGAGKESEKARARVKAH